jgi:SET domain-containing protein
VLLHYGYGDRKLNRYTLCCHDARFINHSATPNLRPRYDEDPHGVDVAICDIDANEEITIDYQELEGDRPAKNARRLTNHCAFRDRTPACR